MNKRVLMWALVALLAGTLVFFAGAQGTPESRDFEGVWRSVDTSNGRGALAYVTHTGGDEFQVVVHEAEPRFPGTFRDTPLVGVARRVGFGRYEYTIMKYRLGLADETIVATAVLSGTVIIDGEGGLTWQSLWSVYSADQDPWGDDSPAFGCFGPFTGHYTRITMHPSCEP